MSCEPGPPAGAVGYVFTQYYSADSCGGDKTFVKGLYGDHCHSSTDGDGQYFKYFFTHGRPSSTLLHSSTVSIHLLMLSPLAPLVILSLPSFPPSLSRQLQRPDPALLLGLRLLHLPAREANRPLHGLPSQRRPQRLPLAVLLPGLLQSGSALPRAYGLHREEVSTTPSSITPSSITPSSITPSSITPRYHPHLSHCIACHGMSSHLINNSFSSSIPLLQLFARPRLPREDLLRAAGTGPVSRLHQRHLTHTQQRVRDLRQLQR